jgi:hypothetical protein
MRRERNRSEAPDLQPAERARGEERQIGRDIPEVRHAELRLPVREVVVGRILRDRVQQVDAAGGARGDQGEQEAPVLQDLPTTS